MIMNGISKILKVQRLKSLMTMALTVLSNSQHRPSRCPLLLHWSQLKMSSSHHCHLISIYFPHFLSEKFNIYQHLNAYHINKTDYHDPVCKGCIHSCCLLQCNCRPALLHQRRGHTFSASVSVASCI